MKSKGFTLLELLIAIVIIGILSAMIVPRFQDASNRAKCNVERSNINIINTQVELYKVNTNYWPTYDTPDEVLRSNTYFPDGAPIDPFMNVRSYYGETLYSLDMRGSPPRMRVYTEEHLGLIDSMGNFIMG